MNMTLFLSPVAALILGASGSPLAGQLVSQFAVTGNSLGDHLGSAVAPAGDFDGDGFDDVGLGASGSPLLPADECWVISGIDGSIAYVLSGPFGSNFGTALCGPGDLNGDGFADVFVGVQGHDLPAVDAGTAIALLVPTLPTLNHGGSARNHAVFLRWIPNGPLSSALTGDVHASGAAPLASGFFVAGLAEARLPVLGIELLVAVDPVNLVTSGNFSFDRNGEHVTTGLSRQRPFIAGWNLHLQLFELGSGLQSSNGLRLLMAP